MTSRERLTQAQYDSLEAMIAAYSAEAVRSARADFHETLDLSLASLERLERILNRLSPSPDPLPAADGDWLALVWGSYFGELLRALYGGSWSMTVYPGSEFSVPTLEIPTVASGANRPSAPSRLFPMMKVYRRLELGSTESLPAFHALIASRIGAGPSSS